MCLFVAVSTNAQEEEVSKSKTGLYVRANVGYGFATIPSVLGIERTSTSYTNVYGTSEPGVYPGIAVGYMFNDYFGFDLGFSYTLGKPKVEDIEYNTTDLGIDLLGNTFELAVITDIREYEHRTTQFRLTPSFVVRGGTGKVAPYARFGLLIPVGGKTVTDTKVDITSTPLDLSQLPLPVPIPGLDENSTVTGSVMAKAESFGVFSLGWNAAFGVDYQINDMISVFGELDVNALTIKSKETKVIELNSEYMVGNLTFEELENNINGIINSIPFPIPGLEPVEINPASFGLPPYTLEEASTYDSHIIYVDELTATSNNPLFNNNVDANQPMDDLARRGNYSSFGINIGVKISF